MPILDNEIIWRPSALQSASTPAQNGARMAYSQLVSAVKNNLFADVSQAERTSGSVQWRKAFIHINSAQDTALLNVRLFLDALTPAGDFMVFQPGTYTDTQDQIASRPYGVGTLYAPLTSGSTQIQLTPENQAGYEALQPFRVGDLLRVSDRPSTGGSGNEEWVTLTAVSYTADHAVLDLTNPLINSFATVNTLVSSVFEMPSVAGLGSGFALTSTAGSFDSATVGNFITHNKGAIFDQWSLLFDSASTFTLSSLSLGALAQSGSIAADFSPINPASSSPYFTIKAPAWRGSFVAGDVLSFSTTPAAIPIWYRREVPAGTFSLANDYASLAVHGESA